jgi:hypothetical protein
LANFINFKFEKLGHMFHFQKFKGPIQKIWGEHNFSKFLGVKLQFLKIFNGQFTIFLNVYSGQFEKFEHIGGRNF